MEQGREGREQLRPNSIFDFKKSSSTLRIRICEVINRKLKRQNMIVWKLLIANANMNHQKNAGLIQND